MYITAGTIAVEVVYPTDQFIGMQTYTPAVEVDNVLYCLCGYIADEITLIHRSVTLLLFLLTLRISHLLIVCLQFLIVLIQELCISILKRFNEEVKRIALVSSRLTHQSHVGDSHVVPSLHKMHLIGSTYGKSEKAYH